jgi:hypothetical protein
VRRALPPDVVVSSLTVRGGMLQTPTTLEFSCSAPKACGAERVVDSLRRTAAFTEVRVSPGPNGDTFDVRLSAAD